MTAAAGLLIADKPRGPSSFAVVARVRKLYGERQVGHGGTLDPLASGVLPVLVGEATKLVPYLMGLEKEYQAMAQLGAATDTYDAEGRITRRATPESLAAVDDDAVRAALASFVGRIAQRPPLYSALKKDGQRLYELARVDAPVMPEERMVEIHEIRLEEITLPMVRFTVRCGKGTYIRSLAHDLGERLGVGAHLVALRRTRVGSFALSEACDPFTATQALPLIPMGCAIAHLPALTIEAEEAKRLRMGQQAPLGRLDPQAGGPGPYRLISSDGELVAIAEWSAGRLSLARVLRR